MGSRGAKLFKDAEAMEKPQNVADFAKVILRVTSGYGEVQYSDGQWGKKIGKHCDDFGLDPRSESDRERFKEITQTILNDPDEVKAGEWRGQNGQCFFFVKDGDAVVVNSTTAEYVTTLKDGAENKRIKDALVLFRRQEK